MHTLGFLSEELLKNGCVWQVGDGLFDHIHKKQKTLAQRKSDEKIIEKSKDPRIARKPGQQQQQQH
jgi:hypothetical protein